MSQPLLYNYADSTLRSNALINSDFRKSSLKTAENYESLWAHSHAHCEPSTAEVLSE